MWEYNYYNPDELRHYGVLGMKWGRRKSTSGRPSSTKKTKKMTADEKKKASMRKDVKNRRTLSDAELKKKIERIKSEKQLKDLTNEEIAPGKKFVSDVLSSSGKKVATALVTGAALYGVKAAMTGKFDIKEAAGYMTPKPKNK